MTHNSVGTQGSVAPPQAIQHALGLHLYQPADNLRYLLQEDEGELRNILRCYERIARHAHKYADVARLHVALSPVLLEQLREPQFIEDCRHLEDIPAILDGLRSAAGIEFLGTGYRHAPLPLVPPQDWDEQLHSERLAMEADFGRVLKGYWPPAGLFTLDMVPVLVRAGYEYVLLPNTVLVSPEGEQAAPYRPYQLCYQDACINVVPYDPGFSRAQESGLEAPWFADEVRNGVAHAAAAEAPYLLTTWSDGENGEWFRRPDEEHGFFGQFYSPYMEFCETGEFPVRPVLLSDYLRAYPPETAIDLKQMPGGPGGNGELQRRLWQVAARYWSLAKAGSGGSGPSRADLLQAHELILRAEDSCYLLDGDASRQTMPELLKKAEGLLDESPANRAEAAVVTPKTPLKDQAAAVAPEPPAKAQATAAVAEPQLAAQPAEARKKPARRNLPERKASSSSARKGSRNNRKKSPKRRR